MLRDEARVQRDQQVERTVDEIEGFSVVGVDEPNGVGGRIRAVLAQQLTDTLGVVEEPACAAIDVDEGHRRPGDGRGHIDVRARVQDGGRLDDIGHGAEELPAVSHELVLLLPQAARPLEHAGHSRAASWRSWWGRREVDIAAPSGSLAQRRSTATESASQTSRMRSSLNRPSRPTRTPTDTLSTESGLTAHRRGTGSVPGSRTPRWESSGWSSCPGRPGPAPVAEWRHLDSARPRGGCRCREPRTTRARRVDGGRSRSGRRPSGRTPDRPTHRPRRPGARRTRRRHGRPLPVDAAHERIERPVGRRGIGACARHPWRPCEEIAVHRGADACAGHGMTVTLRSPAGNASGHVRLPRTAAEPRDGVLERHTRAP